jgi:hypothetical protein
MHKLPTASLGAYFRYFLLPLQAHLIVATPTLPVEKAQTSYSNPLMLPIAAISLFYARKCFR